MGHLSISEMTKWQRKRHSLGGKSFIIVVLLVLAIGSSSILLGSYFVKNMIWWQFKVSTWNLTNSEALYMKSDTMEKKAKEIVRIYNRIPEEDRLEGRDCSEYLDRFNSVTDDDYTELRVRLRELQVSNDTLNAFICIIDLDHNRMIYVLDADPDVDTVLRPGTIESYSGELLQELVYGTLPKEDESFYYTGEVPHATIAKMGQYGLRCTGASEMYWIDGYPVMAMMDNKLDQVKYIGRMFKLQFFCALLVIAVLAAFLVLWLIRRTTVKPLNRMAEAAEAYSSDKKNGDHVSTRFQDLEIRTGDEIEHLAVTMKNMENDIGEYVRNLTRMTAEKERMNAELNLAAAIQTAMLPGRFPAFPDRGEFSLYASMTPAREVGGDFYDFFMVDDDRMAMVIADVTGKGIPAALFMMGSSIMINTISRTVGHSPALILKEANDRLCEKNLNDMFVTVWLGILEVSTGRLTAANAGHEYPAIYRAGGRFELLRDKHGLVLGGMEGQKYKEYELLLQPGDVIFQYTDGVTEATDSDMELFGTDRMLEALNRESGADPEIIIANVADGIEEFVGSAPQFDDITMLCLKYRGTDDTE